MGISISNKRIKEIEDAILKNTKDKYSTIVIDKDAIEAQKKAKGIFVRLAEEALKTSLDNIAAHHIIMFQADCELAGAQKMLEIVKRWLNTEPIEKEIWEAFNKKD